MQIQFTAMRCCAPDPAGGANSGPTELLTGFFGERKGRGEGGKKGKGSERGK